MAEMHSNGSLAVLAPINLNERRREISVQVQDRNGCMQSPQRLPASAWGHSRTVPEHGTTGSKCERWWNEANRSEPEQTEHRHTGFGSSGTGTRESRRDDGCNTEPVWKCSTCVFRRTLLDAKNCKLWPRLPARLTKVYCGPVDWTA